MIKEHKKVSKFNTKQTHVQIIIGLLKTVFVSSLLAALITSCLAIYARYEMIKDCYAETSKTAISKKIAEEILAKQDFLTNLSGKNWHFCLYAGDLYAAAEDFPKAQIAYELAIQKCKHKNYKLYTKLAYALISQSKFKQACDLMNSIDDYQNTDLIKFKTRTNLLLGDKYYSMSKFLSAAKYYKEGKFYYDKLPNKDRQTGAEINARITGAYIKVADLMVKSNMNTDAVRFLKMAEKFEPENYIIKYKMALVLSDSDPEQSVDYLEFLLNKIPQDIDYELYGRTLMKAANIADLDNRPTEAKYYRYKIHSNDLFVDRKVVYRYDFNIVCKTFKVKKLLFTYPLKVGFVIANDSAKDVVNLFADIVLKKNDKTTESHTLKIATTKKPLYSNSYNSATFNVDFNSLIFTKKELKNYTIEVYLYKDKKYKTLVLKLKIPDKSF